MTSPPQPERVAKKFDAYIDKSQIYFGHSRREMLEFVPRGGQSIIEVGCGSGSFGALVKQRDGCRYTGVELVEEQANIARSRLDEVVVANIEEAALPFSPESFDGLICNDVLEHLVDPWKTLKQLVRYVRPSGFVVLSIPNVRFSEVVKDLVFRNAWEYQKEGVLDRTHLRFFTERSFRGLMEGADLRVDRLQGINAIRFAWRLRTLNLLLLGALSPMRFPQFAATAFVRTNAKPDSPTACPTVKY